MSTVALRFQPSSEHVRTARLVAVAVARRAGLDEARLDEVRLAVSEVCARAVRRCQLGAVDLPLLVELDDAGDHLEVVVTDCAPAEPSAEADVVELALVRGLAESVVVRDGPGGPGGLVRLTWDRKPG